MTMGMLSVKRADPDDIVRPNRLYLTLQLWSMLSLKRLWKAVGQTFKGSSVKRCLIIDLNAPVPSRSFCLFLLKIAAICIDRSLNVVVRL